MTDPFDTTEEVESRQTEEVESRPNMALIDPANARPLTGGVIQMFGSGNLSLALYSSVPGLETLKHITGATLLRKMINKPIRLANVIIHPAEVIDSKTGEILNRLRVILVTPEGEAFYSVASGVSNDITLIGGVLGVPPYNPPITVIPTEIETRRGHRMIRLLVDPSNQPHAE